MTRKLTIELSVNEHQRIKKAASMMGTTMKNVVLIAFEDLMQRKFNKVTAKALKLSKQQKGLKKFNSLEDLFRDLGF